MAWPVCDSSEEDRTITEVPLWNGGISFHRGCLIIGGAFAIFASVVSFYLIMSHATHYSKPIEQRHVIRILWMIPIYSLVAWLGTYYYKNEVYYDVIGNCYEAFTISAFFALLCHYIAPDLHTQKEYFRGITPKRWVFPIPLLQKCCGGEHGMWRTPRSGLTWFNVIWIGVFQYCLFRVLMTVIAVVTQYFNVYCQESMNPAFSHIWVLAIECVAVSIAMYCLIQFFIQIKDDISQHRPFLKILSIKLVIFLSFWQSSLIDVLYSSGVLKATDKIQAPDLRVSLPNLIISIEMAIFSVLHLWAFSWKPYDLGTQTNQVTDFYGNGKATYHGGRFGMKALLDALNPMDLVKAIGRGTRWLFIGRRKRMMDPSYQTQNETETIGLNPTRTAAGTNATAYEGAGSMMIVGHSDGYGSPPDEEGQVLLSHAQPNPTMPSTGDLGVAPPPYAADHDGRYYSSHTRQSSAELLEPEPASHSPQRYTPYNRAFNSPYVVSREDRHDSGQFSQQDQGLSTHHYHSDSLQEQPPIPLPDSYQPPSYHYDSDYERR